MYRVSISLAILVLSLFTGVGVSFAEHEVNHRYTLEGSIVDSEGNPWKGALVTLNYPLNPEDSEIRTTVDGEGQWSASFHLHDQNLGDTIRISIPSAGIDIEHVVTFDPTDLVTERVSREDLVSGVEASVVVRPSGSATPYLITFVVLLLVAGAGAIIYSVQRVSHTRTSADPSTPRIKRRIIGKRGIKR